MKLFVLGTATSFKVHLFFFLARSSLALFSSAVYPSRSSLQIDLIFNSSMSPLLSFLLFTAVRLFSSNSPLLNWIFKVYSDIAFCWFVLLCLWLVRLSIQLVSYSS